MFHVEQNNSCKQLQRVLLYLRMKLKHTVRLRPEAANYLQSLVKHTGKPATTIASLLINPAAVPRGLRALFDSWTKVEKVRQENAQRLHAVQALTPKIPQFPKP